MILEIIKAAMGAFDSIVGDIYDAIFNFNLK